MSDGNDDGGYGNPPVSKRFKDGVSGNPRGRPRDRHNRPPYDAVLGQIVTVREDGVERKMSAERAFLRHLTNRGLERGGSEAHYAAEAYENARLLRPSSDLQPRTIVMEVIRPGSVGSALERLRMAKKHDRYRESARNLIEPWLVGQALARFGNRRLSVEEQATVMRAVRTPGKVRWPYWWTARP